MVQVPSIDKKPKYLMDFVATALNEMNDYLSTAVAMGKMDKKSVFNNIKVNRVRSFITY